MDPIFKSGIGGEGGGGGEEKRRTTERKRGKKTEVSSRKTWTRVNAKMLIKKNILGKQGERAKRAERSRNEREGTCKR